MKYAATQGLQQDYQQQDLTPQHTSIHEGACKHMHTVYRGFPSERAPFNLLQALHIEFALCVNSSPFFFIILSVSCLFPEQCNFYSATWM